MAVREMAAVRKIHSQNLIAILNCSEVNSHVCLCAAVRLHVRMLGSEQLPCAIDRCLLNNVSPLAAPVIAPPRVALRILVCENRAHRLEHCFADEVFRSNKFEAIGL